MSMLRRVRRWFFDLRQAVRSYCIRACLAHLHRLRPRRQGSEGPAQEAGSNRSRFHRVPTPDKVSFAANCNSETARPDALPYKLILRQSSRIMASQKLQTCPAQQAVEKARLNIYAPIRLVTNRATRPLRRAAGERITLHIAKEGRLFKNFSS